MTTVALHSCHASLFGRGAPSAGTAGRAVARNVVRALEAFTGGASGAVFHDLHALAAESGEKVEDSQLFSLALRFLTALPFGAKPELARDAEGDIIFDWLGAKGEMLTVALRHDGRLAYACRLSAFDKEHGTKFFSDAVPKTILECIDRFASKAN